jgi:histidinol-phosphatase (PHP family)
MLINYHLHTNYSVDAKGTVDDYCKKAVSHGFNDICFTNHQEFHDLKNGNNDYSLTDEKMDHFFSEVAVAKRKYPSLKIKIGVELGYSKEYKKDIIEFTKKYPFDCIMGSVHWIGNYLYTNHKFPDELSVEERHQSYFKALNEMIRLGYCDYVGHFDVLHKNTPYISLQDYRPLIERCIKSMKENDIGFELNTRGWKNSNKDSYPNAEMLKLLYDSGIRKVTIGSDCHNPEDFADGIKRGLELLKQTGFKEICTFSQRKATPHKIII